MEDFLLDYNNRKNLFEDFLFTNIFREIEKSFHKTLSDAAKYTLSSGGKRLRPILTLSAYLSSSKSLDITLESLYIASSVECIHTYSLIHDDLPAMDDDDFRRGNPTCHKKFTEATAILTGDALNSYGFFLLTKLNQNGDSYLHRDLLMLLYEGAGPPGMVSGQMEDMEMENNPSQFSEKTLESIHSKKTGALITSSLLLGNRLSPGWIPYEKLFRGYGKKLGLLFQLTDDILDEESSLQDLGKTPGKDLALGKLTYPALYGMEKTKKMKNIIKDELIELGNSIGKTKKNNFFTRLPLYISERKN